MAQTVFFATITIAPVVVLVWAVVSDWRESRQAYRASLKAD